ncbi:holo-[acyl-carrier protein] synthase [Parelusimicrobium proximum]|uniref:holo-ACP synthase n=1 Tax=Parelusimicrobium proximum TaxID=3228953 RepID=UPI003D185F0B
MKITGIGTDIIEVNRIAAFAEKEGALERVFTARELGYSLPKKNKYQHLAVRFAAKEAVFKALPFDEISFLKIEILNDASGKPYVVLEDERARGLTVHLTMSHSALYATATALITQ